jgi:beta-lactamase regulating signal transducer with metallopeptidase domain
MSPLTLGNLAAWCIQAALIVGAGLATLWLVRLEAPAVRYLFLRGLLAICLTLPLVQPRTTIEMVRERGAAGGVAIAVASGQARGSASTVAAHALSWPSAIAAVILVGALARLAWIAAGIVKLRRLRRAGAVAEASADHEDLQRVIAARATIRYVRELAQPATFGFLAPVILLPSAVRDQPASIQRAVLAHELWHVRRRDWLWTLCEEGLRAAVWFHPAVWSLLSRIQSAREEVVDELTVLTTGSRRIYVAALLAFADSSPSMAAPAFARRKHLVRRLVLISKEAVMSGRRVVASGAVRRGPHDQLVFGTGVPDAWGAAAPCRRRIGCAWCARASGEADHAGESDTAPDSHRASVRSSRPGGRRSGRNGHDADHAR